MIRKKLHLHALSVASINFTRASEIKIILAINFSNSVSKY